MIDGYTWVEYLWYFLIYSFLGWCVEVIYCTIVRGKVINRGFMNGPVCPIYGCGMIMIIGLTELVGYSRVQNAPDIVLFLVGMFLASSIELVAGWLMMKLFKTRWWDYSMRPFNIGGYICLQFSVIWGFAILGTVRLVHEPLALFVESRLPDGLLGGLLLTAFFWIFVVDFVLTVVTVAGLNKRLKELDAINEKMRIVSDKLSERIGTKALETNEKMRPKMEEGKLQAALAQAELKDTKEDLEARANELRRQIKGSVLSKRLINAFPSMRNVQYGYVMEKLENKTEKMMKSVEEMAAHHIE